LTVKFGDGMEALKVLRSGGKKRARMNSVMESCLGAAEALSSAISNTDYESWAQICAQRLEVSGGCYALLPTEKSVPSFLAS
jgi:hypothetical protein